MDSMLEIDSKGSDVARACPVSTEEPLVCHQHHIHQVSCNLSTWELEMGGSEVQLHGEFEARLGSEVGRDGENEGRGEEGGRRGRWEEEEGRGEQRGRRVWYQQQTECWMTQRIARLSL